MDKTIASSLYKLPSRPRTWYLAGALTFLYLILFILLDTPIFLSGDDQIYLLNATRMFEGQVMYRDFFHFVPPGTELVYGVFFKVFGFRAWIPNLLLILLGMALTCLATLMARKGARGGRSVFLA